MPYDGSYAYGFDRLHVHRCLKLPQLESLGGLLGSRVG